MTTVERVGVDHGDADYFETVSAELRWRLRRDYADLPERAIARCIWLGVKAVRFFGESPHEMLRTAEHIARAELDTLRRALRDQRRSRRPA